MKTLLAVLLTASAVLAQPSVKYEKMDAGCPAGIGFLESLSSNCEIQRIKVTAHPTSTTAAGFFVLVVYRSIIVGDMVTQPQFTCDRDVNGDFVLIFPSGDMSEIVISALELFPGQAVAAQPANP